MNKTFELLRLTRIINETYQTDLNLPTLKQLEELKLHIEQLKTYKIDQTNEVNSCFPFISLFVCILFR